MARWIPVEVALLCGALSLSVPSLAAAQQIPTPGVTGAIAPDPAIDQEQAAAHTAIAALVNGVKHAFTFVAHGGKRTDVDTLQGLHEGQTVVVRHRVAGTVAAATDRSDIGEDGLQATEGTVIDINRGRRQITIRFDNGASDTFHLSDRAGIDAGQDVGPGDTDATRVLVYYSDDSGHKVTRLFQKAS
jgi:hypothetical protein